MLKKLFSRIYAGRKAQSALELSVGAMIIVSLIGATVSQGWGFSFANYNSYRAMRQALMLSYKYSYGAFGPGEEMIEEEFNPFYGGDEGTGFTGSASRLQANVILVEDRLSPSGIGKFGAINRSPLMVQGAGSMTANLFMPQTKPIQANLPRIDVYVNGKHFPFKVADYRIVDLYRPGTPGGGLKGPSPFWEKYCLYAENFTTIQIRNEHGLANPYFQQLIGTGYLPLRDTNGNIVISETGQYAGPEVSDSGEPVPASLNGFISTSWNNNISTFTMTFLPIEKYPNAPWVGCMRLFAREYNHAVARKWCDGQGIGGDNGQCPHVCAEERFDLDLSSQMTQSEEEPPEEGHRKPIESCEATDDVPKELRPYFYWQWFPMMAVVDDKEDDNNGTFGVKEGTRLRYGIPIKSHDYLDVPKGGFGEKSIAGDRDLEEEQIMKFTKIDENFGVIEEMLVQDMQAGDLNFSANDDEEVGFYYGKDVDQDGDITVQAPVNMRAEVQEGTYMSVEDTKTQVITKRQKKKVDLIERVIKLSEGATEARWCAPFVDGEPNPVEVCGNCVPADGSGFEGNRLKTCFQLNAVEGNPAIYVRTIVSDTRGQLWVVDK